LLGPLMFVVPLIVDRRMGLADAVSRSWNAARGQLGGSVLFGLAASLVVIAGAVACAGMGNAVAFGLLEAWPIVLAVALACGIWMVAAVPRVVLAIGVLYRDGFLASAPAVDEAPGSGE